LIDGVEGSRYFEKTEDLLMVSLLCGLHRMISRVSLQWF